MECKLQTTKVKMCVTLCLFMSLTHFAMQVTSLSYHSASGNIIVGLSGGQVEMWQTEPYIALPAHECVRERLVEAQAQANDIQALLEKADSGLRQQMSREQEMKRSIADLEAKCALISDRIIIMDTKMRLVANEKKALEEMQTAEYIAQSRNFTKLMERHNELLGIIHGCTQTLDSLTDCLKTSGLEDLRGEAFKEWLCDIGFGKLQTALKDIDGVSLTMLNVEHVMEYGVSFNDVTALQLRGFIAHYKLSDDSAFAPPTDSVLSWTEEQTANWIGSLGAPYACLSDAGWHGAALCSLSPTRVVDASRGALKVPDAVKFVGLVRKVRSESDSDKATWVTKWTGAGTIELQAAYHPFYFLFILFVSYLILSLSLHLFDNTVSSISDIISVTFCTASVCHLFISTPPIHFHTQYYIIPCIKQHEPHDIIIPYCAYEHNIDITLIFLAILQS